MSIHALILTALAADAATLVRTDRCPDARTVVVPGEPCPPPGPFFVYFAPGATEITAQSAVILDNLLEERRAVGEHLLLISGHADRAGPETYNVALARRRAQAVARYLYARGVPERLARIQSHGEARTAVATPDGIAESQNRRVEIRFEPGGIS